ncbi:hypothetical protein F0U44_09625 [Nocardioides humilatus]|uniref:Polyhydroxybutyrate depolymerase n=1 Tax=Nocardioides humilatus TaxID=2607660 RepID=A0A5B1LDM7_9ACTN|nr:PHB depolymerase family esterase [Nocardioides humilatus]KAA1418742.1 hypothetical protein F0U44_09625 [Nocardioides humilatus]
MRRLFLGIVLLLLLSACSDSEEPTGRITPSIGLPSRPSDAGAEVALPDGTELRYVLHLPRQFKKDRPLPLVLVFHGSPGTPESMMEDTRFNDLADREGFLVVYPDNYSGPHEIPVLLDHLTERNLPIDQRRIYAAGFSRGATAVYDLARHQSGRIAAFAPVSGVSDSGFDLRRVPSLIAVQGTADDLAPGFAPLNREWDRAAGCDERRDFGVRLGGRPAHLTIARCADGTEHRVYSVEGMGHVWPRPATRLVWDFFAAHPLSGGR